MKAGGIEFFSRGLVCVCVCVCDSYKLLSVLAESFPIKINIYIYKIKSNQDV